jgi:hypothetical protein
MNHSTGDTEIQTVSEGKLQGIDDEIQRCDFVRIVGHDKYFVKDNFDKSIKSKKQDGVKFIFF